MTEDRKLYNTKVLATYFVSMTETCTPSLPLPGPLHPVDLKTLVRGNQMQTAKGQIFLLLVFDSHFLVALADFHVPSEYLTNIHIRDKVTVTLIVTSAP